MSNKWTWKTAHLSPGAGVVVVKKVEGQWMVFGMWARKGYDIPKGHVEDGETHFDTAVRECEEECGIAMEGPTISCTQFVSSNRPLT